VGRRLALLLALAAAAAGVAALASGCGESIAEAATTTCGQMRDDASKYRAQARYMVEHERLQGRSLSTERAVLDAELAIRDRCRGEADDYQPYTATRDRLSKRSALDSVAAGG
jgi:hypothetical protein